MPPHWPSLRAKRSNPFRHKREHAFALRQLLGAVAGKTHRSEQGVAETLRAAVILALAVEQRDTQLRRVLAGRMGVADAQRALGTPFTYVSGRPGNEIFLTFRDIGGSGLFPHHDRLYLQFRKGRLAGWKGDWGENWMWR